MKLPCGKMMKRKLNGPLKLLAYLLTANEEVTIFRIRKESGLNVQTIYNAIKLLKNLGLINERYEEGPPPRRLISLTEKGRRAAEHARRLLEIVGEGGG